MTVVISDVRVLVGKVSREVLIGIKCGVIIILAGAYPRVSQQLIHLPGVGLAFLPRMAPGGVRVEDELNGACFFG